MLPTEGKFAKFWPFRVGITLLYGSLEGMERVSDTRILLQTGQFAAELGIDAPKLQSYLRDLEDLMVISDLSIRHGHCVLTLNTPIPWAEEAENDRTH
jgi:hypothetical protein